MRRYGTIRAATMSATLAAGTLSFAAALSVLAGPAAAEPWRGLYVGSQLGISQEATGWDRNAGAVQYGVLGDVEATPGGFAGLNWAIGPNAVIGAEVSGEYTHADLYDETGGMALSVDALIAVAARAGILLTPSTLLYARGGWATMHYDLPEDYWVDQAGSGWLDGFQAGFGMEAMLPNGISLRTQIDYTRATDAIIVPLEEQELTPAFLAAHFGVAYSFGGESPAPPAEAFVPGAWDGLYVGAYGAASGGGTVRGTYTAEARGPFADIDGGFGAWLGYDHQFGPRLVAGAEIEGAWLGLANRDYSDTVDFAVIDWSASLNARIGILAGPRTLVYAKAGIGLLHAEATPEAYLGDAVDDTLKAYQVGGGIETRVWDHLSIRAEGTVTTPLEDLGIPFLGIPDFDYQRPHAVTGRLGLTWRQ